MTGHWRGGRAGLAAAGVVLVLGACTFDDGDQDREEVEPAEEPLEGDVAEPGQVPVDLEASDLDSWLELVEALVALQLRTVELAADDPEGFDGRSVRAHLDALAEPEPQADILEVLRDATEGVPSFVLRRVTLTPHVEGTDIIDSAGCPTVVYRAEIEVRAVGFSERRALDDTAMTVRELPDDAPERERNPTGWRIAALNQVPAGGAEELVLDPVEGCP